jgi:hypothetical protein
MHVAGRRSATSSELGCIERIIQSPSRDRICKPAMVHDASRGRQAMRWLAYVSDETGGLAATRMRGCCRHPARRVELIAGVGAVFMDVAASHTAAVFAGLLPSTGSALIQRSLAASRCDPSRGSSAARFWACLARGAAQPAAPRFARLRNGGPATAYDLLGAGRNCPPSQTAEYVTTEPSAGWAAPIERGVRESRKSVQLHSSDGLPCRLR